MTHIETTNTATTGTETTDQSTSIAVRVGRAHQPLRRAVYHEVQRRIVDGRLQQGERIYEDQLAHELEVSRNPVREALQALEAEGFVELEPRRGARVAVISIDRANDLFEMREALEGMVARLAAARRTPEQLQQLQQVLELGSAAAAAGDVATLPGLNTEFHRVLGEAAHNTMLAETVERMSQLIEWVYTRRITQRGQMSWTEHRNIVDAIAAADPDRAFAEACAHISNARQAFINDQKTTS
jgi:DNA-binding GntR family transcriptional regulator